MPNPYLGGNIGSVEYDGGLLYQPDKKVRNGVVYNPGWTAFIYGDGVATSPEVWINGRSQGWRYSNGQTPTSVSIQSELRMTFHNNGKVSLFVGAMPHGGTFFHTGKRVTAKPARPATPGHGAIPAVLIAPTQSDGHAFFHRNKLRTADVKRVSALTRAGDPRLLLLPEFLLPASDPARGFHDELDGSAVTIVWSGGQVRKRGGDLRPWTKEDTNQDATGYDSAPDQAPSLKNWDMVTKDFLGKPQLSRDILGVVTSRKTVAFPNLDQGSSVGRRNSPLSESATEGSGAFGVSQSRYTQETVQINLRTSSAPRGLVGGGTP